MPFRLRPLLLLTLILSIGLAETVVAASTAPLRNGRRLNVVFIMADDLGYGDLGCYGQQLIRTPHLDRMAAEGMRFTDFYAGSTVCAPSRSVLMTGQHVGRTHVRGNAGANVAAQALRHEDFTVAENFQKVGYRTALCGKWGLGDALPEAESGHPLKQGFDYFYGYLNQTHAHNYYPEFLWENHTRVALRNKVTPASAKGSGFTGGYATERIDFSQDLIMEQALRFVGENAQREFFLYLALTAPHANNEGTRGTGNGQEVPDFGEYADRDWSAQNKGQAALIARLDRDVGRLLARLKELDIDRQTIVFFTSDNGPHNEGGHTPDLFRPGGPLRGMKRDLTEGGIRVPFIARCPDLIPAGTTQDRVSYFGDLMATSSALAGVEAPANCQSLSLLPALRNKAPGVSEHRYLYWEFYERGSAQAVRFGHWKAIRQPMRTGKTALYDLRDDVGEAKNLAETQPDVVKLAEAFMNEAHLPHPNWVLPTERVKP